MAFVLFLQLITGRFDAGFIPALGGVVCLCVLVFECSGGGWWP